MDFQNLVGTPLKQFAVTGVLFFWIALSNRIFCSRKLILYETVTLRFLSAHILCGGTALDKLKKKKKEKSGKLTRLYGTSEELANSNESFLNVILY